MLISIKGYEQENLTERRRVNKNFLDCLVEVKGGCPSAFVWLKRNIDFEISEIMLSDWDYSGELITKLFGMIILNIIFCVDKKIQSF